MPFPKLTEFWEWLCFLLLSSYRTNLPGKKKTALGADLEESVRYGKL
jgi:hypothetical protein